MKIKFNRLIILLLLTLTVVSCKDNDEIKISKSQIVGIVQKGPFINGTQIIMSELNERLEQTGKVFTSQTTNDLGSFEVRNIELTSSYVNFSSNGYYYNENTGELSSSQLTLYALSDITDKSKVNINILTHLEKRRVEYLLKEKNLSFNVAKKKAQEEILAIFGIKYEDIENSEAMDIHENNESNAILLAISVILQGQIDVGNLTELLADISNDIASDGILNDETVFSHLRESAKLLNLQQIKNNLKSRYESNGISISIPDFENYVEKFLAHTALEPVSQINDATAVTVTGAFLTGNVNPNSAATEVVFEYGTTSELGNFIEAEESQIIGNSYIPVSIELNDLESGTVYYYRIKAVNEKGTSYSEVRTFKTMGDVPVILSGKAEEVMLQTAVLTGIINPNYSATNVYFEYGKSTNYGNSIPAEQNPFDENEEKEATAALNDLDPATHYYFRIKAENQFGVSYSESYEFRTEITGVTGTLEDIDGNVYNTIGIGHQMWMAENLKTTKYNDGTDIINITDNEEWANTYTLQIKTPAYCWYENDYENYGKIYGALYNHYAVETEKLCPAGWHVPSHEEWEILINYLGGEDAATDKIKATEYWTVPNSTATNSSGFTALPGGGREGHMGSGKFYELGRLGCWSTSTFMSDGVMTMNMMIERPEFGGEIIFGGFPYVDSGVSVRCIKD